VPHLKTRLAVLEATTALRAEFQSEALALVKDDLERRLHEMNGWRAEEVATKSQLLRADTYEKSEGQHRLERETANARIATLELRLTQVATVGAVLMLLIPFLTLAAAHYLLK
jgi:hypothetical protein